MWSEIKDIFSGGRHFLITELFLRESAIVHNTKVTNINKLTFLPHDTLQ